MTHYYIVATQKGDRYDEGEIIAYKYFTSLSTQYYKILKADFWNLAKDHLNESDFYSYNPKANPALVECSWRQYRHPGSQPFLQSNADGTTHNNLLELPDC